MSMARKDLLDAIGKAKHFIRKAEDALNELKEMDYDSYNSGTAISGATRRASMDLTRSLSELRR